jgi:hypothetical protein
MDLKEATRHERSPKIGVSSKRGPIGAVPSIRGKAMAARGKK